MAGYKLTLREQRNVICEKSFNGITKPLEFTKLSQAMGFSDETIAFNVTLNPFYSAIAALFRESERK